MPEACPRSSPNRGSPGTEGHDGEERSSQSQILVIRGDWSGRYNMGGEPTLLEGLRKCVSKELGVIPTSPFKKSSSSSSTTSCRKNRGYQQDHRWQCERSPQECATPGKRKVKKHILILEASSDTHFFMTDHPHNCSSHVVTNLLGLIF